MPPRLLIVITGPTAVGKTALSLQLAEKLSTEIISADSRQFYREMEIGTAKPTPEELSKTPHHFINNLSIHDEYNAGKYEKEVMERLKKLFITHENVILSGGSGLFVNAICHGFDELPEANIQLRKQYEELLRQKGIEALQAELKEKDPDYFATVDRNNSRRLLRALEVYHQTGMPYSQFRKQKIKNRDFAILKIGLTLDKDILRERINRRVDKMLASGWLSECKKLLPHRHLNAIRTVGYTDIFDYIEGKYDWNTTVQNIKTNTWHYAKRQLTWFKKDKDIQWFSPEEEQKIVEYCALKSGLHSRYFTAGLGL